MATLLDRLRRWLTQAPWCAFCGADSDDTEVCDQCRRTALDRLVEPEERPHE